MHFTSLLCLLLPNCEQTYGDISQRTHICESPTTFCLSEPSKWLRFSLYCSAVLISQQNFILFAVVCTGRKYNFERNGMYIVIIGYDKELNELNSHSTKANGTKTEHRMEREKIINCKQRIIYEIR